MKGIFKKIVRKVFVKLLDVNQDALNLYFNRYLLNTPKFYGDINNIYISEKSNVNNGLFNSASGKIVISDYVFFGHNVSIIAATHDINQYGENRMKGIPEKGHDIIIEEGVWVGSNAIIVGPCRIGRNAVVAAGSVVIKDVDDYQVVGGVPSRVIKKLNLA